MNLDQLPIDQTARVIAVDWDALVPEESRRLKALGIDTGAHLSVARRGVLFWRDPIAVSIGRMVVAVRRVHAAAIEVAVEEASHA